MTAEPPRADSDLRTLAAEAAEVLARRFHEAYERLAPLFGYETREASARPWDEVPANNRALMTAVCAEILAAVLPEHRRMVLAEAAGAIEDDMPETVASRDVLRTAAELVRRLAAAAPPATLSATVPAENAPPVPEDTPGGFHEPDEPTAEVVAAFDAGIPGRTAPPRGQTQWLDLAQAGWQELRDRLAAANAGLQKDNLDLAAQVAHYQRLHERPDIPDDLPALRRRVDREQAEQRVIEAAKAWRDAVRGAPDDDDWHWEDDPYLTIAHSLYAAVEALPDGPLTPLCTGTPAPKAAAKDAGPTVVKSIAQEAAEAAAGAAGWVPLADVLDALRHEAVQVQAEPFADAASAAVVAIGYLDAADYLAERFAPTTPERDR